MRSCLESIAVSDNQKRREFIIEKLREFNCPYFVQNEKIGDTWVQNIIVRFGPRFPKVVLGAHYDTVDGSKGANDNGSGVCILLKLLEGYMKDPKTMPSVPLEIVFFDYEEGRLFGSATYLFRMAPEHVLAMINIDTCGVGDTILLSPAENIGDNPLGHAITEVNNLGKYNIRALEQLPPSDEQSFIKKGIPSILAFTVEHTDVDCMIEAFADRNKEPEKYPAVIETIHNGPRDSINYVDDKAMGMTLNWLKDVIISFK